MRITKFRHSCVLVETGDRTVLFDPGNFSWQSGLIDLVKLPEIHDIVITHEHPDHYDENFVANLIKSLPNVTWITNTSIAPKLKQLGATQVHTDSTQYAKVINEEHADVVPFGVPVENISVEWNGLVYHPGDTLEISTEVPLVCMPMTAPWAKTVDAIKKILELKPKYVLPIHDWMLRDEWIKVVYSRANTLCEENGIKFLAAIDGEPINLE